MTSAQPFRRLLDRWREQRTGQPVAGGEPDVVDVEVIRSGRPGLVDVVAEIDGRLAHAVFGIRRPGDQLRVLGSVEEPTLGTIEDGDGVGLVVDALHDADAARLLLDAVAGTSGKASAAGRGVVSVLRDDDDATALGFDHRVVLTVYPWLSHGPHPGAALLAGLDEAGFNHLPAPVAFWRRAGRDLGIVQELIAGASSGWALAIGSLRDLLAAGVSPDVAGGDFASEALALGTMTARMHMALDRAFGRRPGDVGAWVEALGADAMAADPGAPTAQVLENLARSGLHPPTIRTHGDFHLGRVARTDHGWIVADSMPGGAVPGSHEPRYRSPLADVADLTWSLHRAAEVAADEQGPAAPLTGRARELAAAWEARNRQALVAAYLATPGMGGLVPADRRVVRWLIRLFELARSARGRRDEPAP